jgi:hypothetical protein
MGGELVCGWKGGTGGLIWAVLLGWGRYLRFPRRTSPWFILLLHTLFLTDILERMNAMGRMKMAEGAMPR